MRLKLLFTGLSAAATIKCSVLFRTLFLFNKIQISNTFDTLILIENFLERKDEKC